MQTEDGLTVYDEDFDRLISQRAAVYGKTIEEEFEYQAGRILHRMIRITPPFNGKGSIGAAKKQGERAIVKDMRKIFVPVDLKGQRQINQLFGNVIEPRYVDTKEKHPDVESIWQSRRKTAMRTRSGRAMFYVDRRKFDRLARKKKKNVGKLGSGYKPAAGRLGVALPAFMKRHRSPGSITVDSGPDLIRIVITNGTHYAHQVPEFRRRIEWAVSTQKAAMERQLNRAMKQLERNPI
jgi:hypothetical protein